MYNYRQQTNWFKEIFLVLWRDPSKNFVNDISKRDGIISFLQPLKIFLLFQKKTWLSKVVLFD